MHDSNSSLHRLRALVLLLLLSGALTARAVLYTNSTVSPWTNSAAWTGGVSLDTNNASTVIMLSGTASTTRTNDYDIVVLNQLHGNTTSLILSGPGILRFTNAGAIVQNNVSGAFTINEKLEVTGVTTFRTTGTSPST
ncbi:MAG: hypothetical protein ACOYMV_08780 [Verrucomicrobiia bacterium]